VFDFFFWPYLVKTVSFKAVKKEGLLHTCSDTLWLLLFIHILVSFIFFLDSWFFPLVNSFMRVQLLTKLLCVQAIVKALPGRHYRRNCPPHARLGAQPVHHWFCREFIQRPGSLGLVRLFLYLQFPQEPLFPGLFYLKLWAKSSSSTSFKPSLLDMRKIMENTLPTQPFSIPFSGP
jgi:hypothetical protein